MPTRGKPLYTYSIRATLSFSYARSAGVLQQGRHMGGRAQPARPVRTTWAHAADLRSGHLAWGARTRVPADPALHPAGQRQLDRVDGRPLRWRSIGEPDLFQLSKQQLMYGPMQIESRIDQDQNISKDLSLWNQQSSHVLRGSIIALPVSGASSTSSPFTFRPPRPAFHSSRRSYWPWVTG